MKETTANNRNIVLVIFLFVAILGLVYLAFTLPGSPKAPTTSTSPSPTPTPKSDTVSKMQSINKQLSAVWQVCQIDTTKCLASVAQIASANDLFNSRSSQFKGTALDDFTGWRQDVGLAEGDMKQWSVNAAFSKDNSTLSSTIPSEVQDSQTQLANFTKD